MKKIKFNWEVDASFTKHLNAKVNAYFTENNITRYGNFQMVLKAIVMFAMFFLPLLTMMVFQIENLWVLFGLWTLTGLGMAGIGSCVSHDALHGSFSKNQTVNKLMGLSLNIVGANAYVWKIQHNVLHHTYTNIADGDQDIQTPFILRFSPHRKRLWIHRFQPYYVWLFYGISTLFWVTVKDFVQMVDYKKRKLIKSSGKFWAEFGKVVLWKAIYYGYILVLPMIFLPVSPWMVVLMFVAMHFVAGLVLSIIFQTAHVVPSSEFVEATGPTIQRNWSVHQLLTTSNFSPNSRWLSWLIGGLNYQIEHHLFPNICHIHYRKLSRIIRETAQEFGIPYHSQKNFAIAVASHVRLLNQLGKKNLQMVRA